LSAGSLPSSFATTLRESIGAQRVRERHRGLDAERHRLEVAGERLLLQRVEVLPAEREQLLRRVVVITAFDARLAHVLVGRDEIELLAEIPLDDVEAVSGGRRVVDDETAAAPLRAPSSNL
jgi:hypothetical protein